VAFPYNIHTKTALHKHNATAIQDLFVLEECFKLLMQN